MSSLVQIYKSYEQFADLVTANNGDLKAAQAAYKAANNDVTNAALGQITATYLRRTRPPRPPKAGGGGGNPPGGGGGGGGNPPNSPGGGGGGGGGGGNPPRGGGGGGGGNPPGGGGGGGGGGNPPDDPFYPKKSGKIRAAAYRAARTDVKPGVARGAATAYGAVPGALGGALAGRYVGSRGGGVLGGALAGAAAGAGAANAAYAGPAYLMNASTQTILPKTEHRSGGRRYKPVWYDRNLSPQGNRAWEKHKKATDKKTNAAAGRKLNPDIPKEKRMLMDARNRTLPEELPGATRRIIGSRIYGSSGVGRYMPQVTTGGALSGALTGAVAARASKKPPVASKLERAAARVRGSAPLAVAGGATALGGAAVAGATAKRRKREKELRRRAELEMAS